MIREFGGAHGVLLLPGLLDPQLGCFERAVILIWLTVAVVPRLAPDNWFGDQHAAQNIGPRSWCFWRCVLPAAGGCSCLVSNPA
jgi:hypothetical protein